MKKIQKLFRFSKEETFLVEVLEIQDNMARCKYLNGRASNHEFVVREELLENVVEIRLIDHIHCNSNFDITVYQIDVAIRLMSADPDRYKYLSVISEAKSIDIKREELYMSI